MNTLRPGRPLRASVFIAAVLLFAGALAFPAGPAMSDDLGGGELLPDLQTLDPANFSVSSSGGGNGNCPPWASCGGDSQHFLLFDNEVMNLHTGPLELVRTDEHCTTGKGAEGRFARQRVYIDANDDGGFTRGTDTSYTDYPAGCITWHAEHLHWHYDDFAYFELLDDGVPVADSLKMTFCVADVNRRAGLMNSGSEFSPASRYYNVCSRNAVQGLSVGWGDNYPNGTSGQYIDVTNVVDGTYCFVSTADHLDKLRESNEGNNVNSRWITLSSSGGSRTVSEGTVGCYGGNDNTPSTADDGAATTSQDSSVSISLTGADADGCAGQTFTFDVTTGPNSGSLDNSSGAMTCIDGSLSTTVTYTPDPGITGSDSFNFTISDGPATSNTATVAIIVTEQGTTTHVGDLDGIKANATGSTWEAVVVVDVHDANHNPVESAVVSGSWSSSKGYLKAGFCITDETGRCSVPTGDDIHKSHDSVTFIVTGVSHSTLDYDPDGNHDPDGDSDGTGISVSK